MKDLYNAYVSKNIVLEPTASGILTNLTFSVKDVFSIKGYTNTAGNPDWFRTHKAANQTATVIETLLQAGATMKGTTHTDELMYSLNGENFHYGTPDNPKAPGHIPGGSSSGSAVAASAGVVDFTIGTDTGGSVRIPSSYCGIYGIRPTHGAVSVTGLIPLAESFDTVGWMAEDSEMLLKVGKVLLPDQSSEDEPFSNFILAEDAWALAEEETRRELEGFIGVLKQVGNVKKAPISAEGLSVWADTFRIIQAIEIWEEHGNWVESVKPTFGPGISDRFVWAITLEKSEHSHQFEIKEEVRKKLSLFLGTEGVLVIPTAPAPAPLKGLSDKELEERRTKTMQLSCIAGIAGLPQVTLPVANVDGKPVGLSLIANHNQDLRLLKLAKRLQFEGVGRS